MYLSVETAADRQVDTVQQCELQRREILSLELPGL